MDNFGIGAVDLDGVAVLFRDSAVDIMLREPILIRRPLIDCDGRKACGVDDAVLEMLGIEESSEGMEACPSVTERCD
jgi:hypothetical protein